MTDDQQTPEYHEAQAMIRLEHAAKGSDISATMAVAHATLAVSLHMAEANDLATAVATVATADAAADTTAVMVPTRCTACGTGPVSLSWSVAVDVAKLDPNRLDRDLLVHAGCDTCSASIQAWPLGEFLAKVVVA